MDSAELWADLRQGARNVAGVSWQVNVCVYLLIASHAGELPFVRITPEGFEDADCEHADGSRTFVQMKELAAGDGRMTAAAVAEALAHADTGARGSKIALVTDASLGSGLGFTGWDGLIGDSDEDKGAGQVVAALTNRGYSTSDARALCRRSHLIELPYRVRELSEALLAEAGRCHPTVAGISVGRLTEVVAAASADQRSTTASTALRLFVSDVNAALTGVLDAVDVEGLDAAIVGGVCAPADFLIPDATPAHTFYLGVDGQPGHIAANLDVVRPAELAACAEGLVSERSVVVSGPSGSGKSVLLWRAARDLMPAARVLRVLRLQTTDDSAALARHVRMLRPTDASPVLVVADDLGRPETLFWPDAARRLREERATFLLAAARSEDLQPALLVGATRIVEPRLDPETATSIGTRLADVGFDLKMDVREASQRSEGLLMEFIALLTTGQRLRQVLAQQVAGLKAPGRELQRELARLVCAAHTLGLSLDAERLGLALAPHRAPEQVGDALAVLRDEHIVVRDGQKWSGLHELRSATLTDLLHENPPPTLGATLSKVAEVIDQNHLGWMLRRLADRLPDQLAAVMPAVESMVASPSVTARQAAHLLEGAERADNTLYVRAALPVLRAHLPAALPLEALATLTYPVRNQGISYDAELQQLASGALGRIAAVAQKLPARTDYDATVASASAGLTPARLAQLLEGTDPVDAVRLLEAGGSFLQPAPDALQRLLAYSQPPHDPLTAMHRSRLIAACAPHLPPEDWDELLGTIEERARMIVEADPCALDLEIDHGSGTIRVERIAPIDPSIPPLMEWDFTPALGSNAINNDTVACLQRLVDACPELQNFQMITLSPSGGRYRVGDHEPGHKDMHRSAFPERASVRQSVGFQAALRRATSSATWTEVVTRQIAAATELTSLASQVPLRLKPDDNARRRHEWNGRLQTVREDLASLGVQPKPQTPDLTSVQAQSDDADRTEDVVTGALTAVADSLHNLLVDDPATELRPLIVTMSLRSAVDELRAAKIAADTVLDHRGSSLPVELLEALTCAANLAAALAIDPKAARKIRGTAPQDSAQEIYAEVREGTSRRRHTILCAAVRTVPDAKVTKVIAPDPADWSLDESGWLVTVPLVDLEQAVEALELLADDERDAIGSPIVLLATEVAAVRPGPSGASQDPVAGNGSPHQASLGIGMQLSSTQSRPSLPLTPDVASAWAEAGSLPTLGHLGGATRVTELLDSLIMRSWTLARNRLRTLTDSGGDVGVTTPVDEIVAASGIAVVDLDESSSDLTEGDIALGLLVDQVRAEERGDDSVVLAGLMVDAIGGPPVDPYEQQLLVAMTGVYLDLVVDSTRSP